MVSKGKLNHTNKNRVTIMIDKDLDKVIKYAFASEIIKNADEGIAVPNMNYSRMLNNIIRDAFKKGLDKKVLAKF